MSTITELIAQGCTVVDPTVASRPRRAPQPKAVRVPQGESFSLDAATLAKVCDSNTIARMFGLPAKPHALEVTHV